LRKSSFLSILLPPIAFASVLLTGCGGTFSLPDTQVTADMTDGPAMEGSVYGGHAPITGSHVYVLQPGTSGYGSAATSLLGTGTTNSPGGYTIHTNSSDPNVPSGAKYVTTDSNGNFNLTGGYKCTPGQPVFLYSYGGITGNGTFSGTSTQTFSISQIVVSNVSGSGGNQTATYTVTINSTQPIATANLSGLANHFTIINTTQTVTSSTDTTFSFTASTRYSNGNIGSGTYTTSSFGTSGKVLATITYTNPIVEMSTLGNCPTNGNFFSGNTALSYVFMNEVSTVVTAYTFQPFTVASNNSAWDIGTSGTTQALTAIANAANMAGQLYNIQGNGPDTNQFHGEGHIANATTTAGNGTVPQATIDSLANIIAACVDSGPLTNGDISSSCSSIFTIATDGGQTLASGDTAPIDTATAAMNIARYPQGNHSSGSSSVDATYASDLLSILTGVVPYTPDLGTTAPKDWSLAITYNNIATPGSIAIDASGNAFVPTNATSGYVTKLSPQGAVLATSATGGGGFDSIAIDSGGNVFVAAKTSNAMYAYTNSLGAVTGSPFSAPSGVDPTSVVVDSNTNGNYVYLTGPGNSNYPGILRFSNNASSTAAPTVSFLSTISNSCLGQTNYITVDSIDEIWAASDSYNLFCIFPATGGNAAYAQGYNTPTNVAIDSYRNGWFGAGGQTDLWAVNPLSGHIYDYGLSNSTPQGGLNKPSWVAIDGADNIWITNSGNSFALSEFTNTANPGLVTGSSTFGPITSSTAYESGVLDAPSFIAIDPSGDVWIPNKNGNTVTEIIGIAAPTSTPLSNLTPGTEP
jgi:hypothetical protein